MDKFIILADVTCDLTEEMREFFGVQDYIPGHINLGNGREEITRLEWDYIEAKEFYKMLGSKENKISTAPPNLEEYYSKFVSSISSCFPHIPVIFLGFSYKVMLIMSNLAPIVIFSFYWKFKFGFALLLFHSIGD